MTAKPYGHDPDDPLSEVSRLEAALLTIRLPNCRHCRANHQPVPMGGIGWGVETIHERACPEHDANQPAPRRPNT